MQRSDAAVALALAGGLLTLNWPALRHVFGFAPPGGTVEVAAVAALVWGPVLWWAAGDVELRRAAGAISALAAVAAFVGLARGLSSGPPSHTLGTVVAVIVLVQLGVTALLELSVAANALPGSRSSR